MRYLILCLTFAISIKISAQDTIYNAYTLSKAIVAFEQEARKGNLNSNNDTLKKALGLLAWYANVMDGDSRTRVNIYALDFSRYPGLKNKYKTITAGLTNSNALAQLTKRDVLELLEKEEIKNHLAQRGTKGDAARKFKDTLLFHFGKKDTAYFQLLEYSRRKGVNENAINELKEDTIELGKALSELKVKLEKIKADTDTLLVKEFNRQLKIQEDVLKKKGDDIDKITKELEQLKDDSVSNQKAFDHQVDEIKKLINNSDDLLASEVKNNISLFETKLSIDGRAAEVSSEEQIKAVLKMKETIIERSEQSSTSFRLPSQAEIIDALAIYLAKRVKQEAIMWFFETIKKNAGQYELIQTFFPNTITLLQSKEIYEIPNLGSQWRYALSKDFVTMPRNVFKSNWFKRWFQIENDKNKQILYEYLMTGLDMADLLLQRYNYRDLVKQMYLQQTSIQRAGPAGKGLLPRDIFALLYSINQECFIIDNKVTGKTSLLKFENLMTMSREELEIMICLIDMKYDRCISRFFGTTTLTLKSENVGSFRRWLGGIETGISQFQKLQADFLETQKAIKEGNTTDIIYSQFNMWDNLYGLFDIVVPDSALRPAWMINMNNEVKRIKSVTNKSFEVYHQITLKNYAGAVSSTLTLLEDLFYSSVDATSGMDSVFMMRKAELEANIKWGKNKVPTLFNELDSIKNKVGSDVVKFSRKDYTASVVFEKDRHAIQLIRKLSGFLNDVMLSTDSKTLARVVESYALPPGSYKRKRNSWISVDLNAFVGAYAGYEIARKKDGSGEGVQNDGWVYGITAPIGISFSKTFGKKIDRTQNIKDEYIRNPDKIRFGKKDIYCRSNTTFTITASIIDIGAVVSYRFNNTADSVLPQNPTWSQVFSPGFSIAWGIKHTPLVLSLGYQYTPQLRSISKTTTTTTELQLNSNRIALSLLFDLPLINLWQRSYIPARVSK